MSASTKIRKVTGRGCLRKLWDGPGRRWYMVCPCSPGKLYTLGPVGTDMNTVMAQASRDGWRYDPLIGWSCPECVSQDVHAQLDKRLAKPVVAETKEENGAAEPREQREER